MCLESLSIQASHMGEHESTSQRCSKVPVVSYSCIANLPQANLTHNIGVNSTMPSTMMPPAPTDASFYPESSSVSPAILMEMVYNLQQHEANLIARESKMMRKYCLCSNPRTIFRLHLSHPIGNNNNNKTKKNNTVKFQNHCCEYF